MTDEVDTEARAALPPCRIVGLGASAGGLLPLAQFLAQVPTASGLAYVVVQHMDPTHKALLADLLQRATAMPVQEVGEAMPLHADHVYVIPPAAEITVAGGLLHVAEPSQPRGQRLPIDVMFSSMARELGNRAIGVVLSGMGADGTAGLQAIKNQGGLTLAQQPESAQFDAMPRSAIAVACVDIVGLPAELPARILANIGRRPPGAADGDDSAVLDEILAVLHAHTRRDLALYKSLVSFFGPDDAQRLWSALADLAAGRTPPPLALGLSPRDGGTRQIQAHLSQDPAGAGQALVVLAVRDEAAEVAWHRGGRRSSSASAS